MTTAALNLSTIKFLRGSKLNSHSKLSPRASTNFFTSYSETLIRSSPFPKVDRNQPSGQLLTCYDILQFSSQSRPNIRPSFKPTSIQSWTRLDFTSFLLPTPLRSAPVTNPFKHSVSCNCTFLKCAEGLWMNGGESPMQHLVSSNNRCNSRVSIAGEGGREQGRAQLSGLWQREAQFKSEHLRIFFFFSFPRQNVSFSNNKSKNKKLLLD